MGMLILKIVLILALLYLFGGLVLDLLAGALSIIGGLITALVLKVIGRGSTENR